jgi:nitroimidazol reductase NimA-like FMN-containing flavoprotein (pyridoxamine 5'-phosphate oxidase superfamily)
MEMAAEGDTNGDLQAHVNSYGRFIDMMKYGAVICLVVAFIVMLVIS